MLRIAANDVPAQVIKDQSFWDLSLSDVLKHEPMSYNDLSLEHDLSVAVSGDGAPPEPAFCLVVNLNVSPGDLPNRATIPTLCGPMFPDTVIASVT